MNTGRSLRANGQDHGHTDPVSVCGSDSAVRVAVKYCGGCNPRWNRAEIAARLAQDKPGVLLVRAGEPADVVAVVCGCEAACAEHEGLCAARGKMILTQAADYEKLRRLLGTIEKE